MNFINVIFKLILVNQSDFEQIILNYSITDFEHKFNLSELQYANFTSLNFVNN